ncbi:MAG: DASS family sodium-coupled anion symporter [Candidatus Omnitrophica bacterium]|nr:DASS family sodium-coupled anion symporter [Candidatus Omnitrophota bacterium]
MKSLKNILMEMLQSRKCQKAALAVMISLFIYWIFPVSAGEAPRRMAFIFTFAALSWAMEIIPLYTTGFLVVLLEMFLLCRPGGALGTSAADYKIFMLPFGSPIIMLFLGGLVTATALHKYELDHIIANKLLKLFGSKPYTIMLGFMFTTAFLSMWMSNTATTAMMIAMVVPLLKQIDNDDPFKKGIVLSIPFAANIGGIGTPVGTPPNAIALGILADQGVHLSFTSWMVMAVPLALVLLFIASVILYKVFPPQKEEVVLKLTENPRVTRQSKMTAIVAVVTILLWLTSAFHKIPSAMVALLAVGLFFGLHLLDHNDLKKIDWHVLVLMWGGLALGKGLDVSGLTTWLVGLDVFNQTGLVLVVAFSFLGLVLGTFMSHTATANLLIPIVLALPGENSVFLAITISLACSFAMALPISTPPNAIAFATDTIHIRDMIRTGALISIISFLALLAGFQFVITKVFGLG